MCSQCAFLNLLISASMTTLTNARALIRSTTALPSAKRPTGRNTKCSARPAGNQPAEFLLLFVCLFFVHIQLICEQPINKELVKHNIYSRLIRRTRYG